MLSSRRCSFFANSWPAHITSNGRYLAAPTSQGEVFIWNLRTGDLVSVLTDHEGTPSTNPSFPPQLRRRLVVMSGHS
jgi:WD40 repeat protein